MADISLKICIWMNMPSHHQTAFFKALSDRKDIDLRIRYYKMISDDRKKLGWDDHTLFSYEKYTDNIDDAINSLVDWKERIHIIPGISSPFLRELINMAIVENVKWIHWSERAGIGLAGLLHFNYSLINLFYPLFLRLKGYRKYSKQINQYALGAFAIGKLAKEDFLNWGVENQKIELLSYSLAALDKTKKVSIALKKKDEITFSFMYIGSLDERKGIDVLIKAFGKLNSSDHWNLILVGDDRSNGIYMKQVEELGLIDRVKFTGVIDSSKINEYLNQADVFILPTRFDGWGAVLNEAASLKKAMISTNQAGAAYHLIKDGENGYMVKAGDINELSKAMKFYIDNPEKINTHGEKSFEILQKYTPEENAKLFVSTIKKWLN